MHNFKRVLKTFLVLAVCVALLAALDLALYPCTFMRNDVHAVVTTFVSAVSMELMHTI